MTISPPPDVSIARHRQEGYNVSRVLATLELLADGPRTAAQVAANLHICTRTARRILYRLALDGYVRRTPTWRGAFCAGPRLAELGRRLADPG